MKQPVIWKGPDFHDHGEHFAVRVLDYNIAIRLSRISCVRRGRINKYMWYEKYLDMMIMMGGFF